MLRIHHLNHSLRLKPPMTDPFFISESGQVATRFRFHHHFHHILSLSGILRVNYSRHSFRIRAATSASHNGIPEHFMRLMGRWSSQKYHHYIRSDRKDSHNLISSDWRFLGVRRCLGAATDSLQSFPPMHSKNSKNQHFVPNKSFNCI